MTQPHMPPNVPEDHCSSEKSVIEQFVLLFSRSFERESHRSALLSEFIDDELRVHINFSGSAHEFISHMLEVLALKPETIDMLLDMLKSRHGLDRGLEIEKLRPKLKNWATEKLAVKVQSPCQEFKRINSEFRSIRSVVGATKMFARSEVGQIIQWINESPNSEKPKGAVIVGKPGLGKSALMRQVLEKLEEQSVCTLGIRADRLGDVANIEDLSHSFELSQNLVTLIKVAASRQRCVVLVDQIDALASSVNRNQNNLNVVLRLIAQLLTIQNVHVVVSCRKFELETEPPLRDLMDSSRFHHFELGLLAENDVHSLVPRVPRRELQMLCVPLYLDLYLRFCNSSDADINSLHSLYSKVWERAINGSDSPAERQEVLFRMVSNLLELRQPYVPETKIPPQLALAAQGLMREGLITHSQARYYFAHQTFFEYCHARWFVSSERDLASEILNSSQGLDKRAQMLNVLAYLRFSSPADYRKALDNLSNRSSATLPMRSHLRLLLLSWLASLPNATTVEYSAVDHLVENNDDYRAHFLHSVQSDTNWLELLHQRIVEGYLSCQNATLIEATVRFIGRFVNQKPELLNLLTCYRGASPEWDGRIIDALAQLKRWTQHSAEWLKYYIKENKLNENGVRYFLDQLVQTAPELACDVLSIWLRANSAQLKDFGSIFRNTLMGHVFDECSSSAPKSFLRHLFPLFEEAATSSNYPLMFAPPGLTRFSESQSFTSAVITALRKVAREEPTFFSIYFERLHCRDETIFHEILIEALLSAPERYQRQILEYFEQKICCTLLLCNPKAQMLFKEIYIMCSPTERAHLESLIVNYSNFHDDQKFARLCQFRILKALPNEQLQLQTLNYLQGLEHEFTSDRSEHEPNSGEFQAVTSPIALEQLKSMTVAEIIDSLLSYQKRPVQTQAGRIIGFEKLLGVFCDLVAEKFDVLYVDMPVFAQRIPSVIPTFISGLCKSKASDEWLVEAITTYRELIEGQQKQLEIIHALAERFKETAPDAIVRIVLDWSLTSYSPHLSSELSEIHIPSSSKIDYLYTCGINTICGAAIKVSVKWMLNMPNPDFHILAVLERGVQEPIPSVRIVFIDALAHWFDATQRQEEMRAIELFKSLMRNDAVMLTSAVSQQFLRWMACSHFRESLPYLERMINHTDETVRETAAGIACLAAFYTAEALQLVNDVLSADSVLRRGAAAFYAFNVNYKQPDTAGFTCINRLASLLNDEDAKVRHNISQVFYHLHGTWNDTIEKFIRKFISSSAFQEGALQLLNYLSKHNLNLTGIGIGEVILSAAEQITGHPSLSANHTSSMLVLSTLAPLLVVVHYQFSELSNRAMDYLERLMLLYPQCMQLIQRAEDEWWMSWQTT